MAYFIALAGSISVHIDRLALAVATFKKRKSKKPGISIK